MVIMKSVDLPLEEELETPEINLSSAHLMAAAPYLGKFCENINNEYMLCRIEHKPDPRECVDLGKMVTKCTMDFFQKLKRKCYDEHMQYANCIDKSSGNYSPWFCRKTHGVYEMCMKEKLCIEHPGFGYFTRGRIHTSNCKEKPEEICPCVPVPGDETRHLPDCKKRTEPRFGSRLFWIFE